MSHDHHHHDHAGQHHGGGHSHSVSPDADSRYLTIAFLLIVGLMAFEVVVGILAHSLALLSDAVHMLTDAGALALSLAVLRYVRRPGGEALTYGRRRAEVLSGQANGAVLLVLVRFKIAHTTLQVDHAQAELLSIQRHGVWPSTPTA